LFRRGALGLAALGLGARRGNGQAPAPDTATADRLYRPDLVQQRGIATASDNDPVVKSLEHRLKCTCGCNLDIYTCRTTDFTCTYSPALHREVLDLRAAGKGPEQVVDAFVAKYGEQILMAPPPHGFNLAGYLVPGAAVAVAGSMLALILIRRGRRMAAVADAVQARGAATPAEPSPEDRERLRDALSRVQD